MLSLYMILPSVCVKRQTAKHEQLERRRRDGNATRLLLELSRKVGIVNFFVIIAHLPVARMHPRGHNIRKGGSGERGKPGREGDKRKGERGEKNGRIFRTTRGDRKRDPTPLPIPCRTHGECNAFRRRAEKRLRKSRPLDFGSKESNRSRRRARARALAVSREIAAARNCTRAPLSVSRIFEPFRTAGRRRSSADRVPDGFVRTPISRAAATLITLDRGSFKNPIFQR